MPERRYDEEEIAEILRAASEIQAGTSEMSGQGLTLSEVQRLAEEVGIDRAHVSAAAAEIGSSPLPKSRFRFWGAPARVLYDRTCDGLIGDEGWEDVVAALRAATGRPGVLSTHGASREWSGGAALTSTLHTATP